MNREKNPKSNLPVLKSYPEEIDMILKFFAISDTIDDALTLYASLNISLVCVVE